MRSKSNPRRRQGQMVARQETLDENYDDHVTAEPSNESYVNDIAA